MRLELDSPEALVAPAPAMPESRGLHHLFTPEQMAFVLQRERARADRHKREFSLVLFRSESEARSFTGLHRLAKIVLAHARTTDEVGKFDRDSVCVVMPDTHANGAWMFAHRVCDSAKRQGLMPVCVVYTYPSAWFPINKKNNGHNGHNGHNGNGHNGHGGNGHNGHNGHNGNGHNGNGHNGNGHNGHSHTVHHNGDRRNGEVHADSRRRALMPLGMEAVSHDLPPNEIPIQRMETLLVRPMPWWKRTIDVAGALTALTIFSPVMLVIAALIKITSPGPVMFKQKRAGLGGRPFEIFKFRSMCTDAEAKKAELRQFSEQDGPAFKMKSDPRITKIGKFIRATSLDELPQLWNVVTGEMSLVGPRPLPLDEQGGADQWHQRRLEVTPGLTCIWQIKGRSRVTFDEWVRMDINYIRRRTIKHDLSILAQTIPAVLLRRGAR